LCGHGEARARETADLEMLHRRRVGRRPDGQHIGVEIAADTARLPHRLTIDLAEACRCAEAIDRRLEFFGIEREDAAPARFERRYDPFRIVIVARDLAQAMRLRVIGRQGLRAPRPAAMLDPGALTEIDGIERPAPATPAIGVTTEVADLTEAKRVIRQSDIAPLVKRLRLPIEVEVAAFEETDIDAAIGQPLGKGNAGSTGADDAEIGGNFRPRRHATRVNEHDVPLPSTRPVGRSMNAAAPTTFLLAMPGERGRFRRRNFRPSSMF